MRSIPFEIETDVCPGVAPELLATDEDFILVAETDTAEVPAVAVVARLLGPPLSLGSALSALVPAGQALAIVFVVLDPLGDPYDVGQVTGATFALTSLTASVPALTLAQGSGVAIDPVEGHDNRLRVDLPNGAAGAGTWRMELWGNDGPARLRFATGLLCLT